MNAPVQDVSDNKLFSDPSNISWEQFTTIVGGKFYSKNKGREIRTYGLLNSKLFNMDSKVQDHPNSPTYGELFHYTPAVNSNGKPFRKWTRLTSLNKKQASWLIENMMKLPDRPRDDADQQVASIPPVGHDKVTDKPVKLADGRYHLEDSGGFYVTVSTSEKTGRQTVRFSV